MIDLYNIDDAFLILNKKKRFISLLIISFIVLLCLIVGITWLSDSYFIMIIDIILTTIYLCIYLYTYFYIFCIFFILTPKILQCVFLCTVSLKNL